MNTSMIAVTVQVHERLSGFKEQHQTVK